MENSKVSHLRCFAVAILIAIAGVFGSKNAFALEYNQPVKYDSNLLPYIGCESTTGQSEYPYSYINCASEPEKLYIKDGSGDISLKPGDSIEIVLSIISKKNRLISLNAFYPTSNAPYLSVVKTELKQVNSNSFYYILTLDILNNSDTTSTYLQLNGVSGSIWSGYNQDGSWTTSNYLISAVTYLKYNYQNGGDSGVDSETVNDNQKATKESRENIKNQDKSGSDYGTGNKQESLLSAIRRFGQALTYQKGDCSANIPAWGSIFSGMTVDLCNTGVAITGLSVILSVVAVFFFIPLAKSWLDTIIGLIKEMQG